MPWNNGNIQDQCILRDHGNNASILLYSRGRIMVSFMANVKTKACCNCDISIILQMRNAGKCVDVFTLKEHISGTDTAVTVSMSGIIIDTSNYYNTPSLCVKLVSPGQLMVEDAILNIVDLDN